MFCHPLAADERGIGTGARADHRSVADQLYALYAEGRDTPTGGDHWRSGYPEDRRVRFARRFEAFIGQGWSTAKSSRRSIRQGLLSHAELLKGFQRNSGAYHKHKT